MLRRVMTTDAVRAWAENYRVAWEQSDADGAAALFAESTSYRSNIFAEPHVGRDGVRAYWAGATGAQEGVSVRIGNPIVDRDRVAIEWWTEMRDREDGDVTLPGVLFLSFDEHELCTGLREYYDSHRGRRSPFAGWGVPAPGETERTRAAARRWAAAWERSWRTHEVEHAARLYSDTVVFRSHPFRDAAEGRAGVVDYMKWAFAAERDQDPAFGEPRVDGASAAVEYWTTAVDAENDSETTIAGCSLLTFDTDGRVVGQHDYWHQERGRRRPPAQWGA